MKKYSYYLVLIVCFILHIFILKYCDLVFDSTPLQDDNFQILPINILQNNLIHGLSVFTFQPPLFNLFLGSILKIFESSYSEIFQIIYLLITITITFLIFIISNKIAKNSILAILASIIYLFAPATFLHENILFYTHTISLTLCLSGLFLYLYITNKNMKYLILFILSSWMVGYQHYLYSILWVLGTVLIIFLVEHKKILNNKNLILIFITALLPFFVLAIRSKVVNGTFSSGTVLVGMQLRKSVYDSYNPDELKLVKSSLQLSSLSNIGPYEPFKNYQIPCDFHGETDPLLISSLKEGTSFRNYNHLCMKQVGDLFLNDALLLIQADKLHYLKYLVEQFNHKIFQNAENHPPFDSVFKHKNLEALKNYRDSISYFYFNTSYGSFTIAFFYLIFLSGSIIFRRKKFRLFYYFSLWTVCYTFLITGLITTDELSRYRSAVDPLVFINCVFILNAYRLKIANIYQKHFLLKFKKLFAF